MKSTFAHQEIEGKVYGWWEESGGMTPPDGNSLLRTEKEPFCVIMPPPNANDPLHVGHAMFITLEDIMVRFERMRGKAVLWLPGTDHAGIETQFVYEKKLQKQGKSRFDFDRQTLYDNIYGYVNDNSSLSIEQMKRLGASADWSRLKFTLDDDIVDLVLSTFEKMHQEGLVTRKQALVNFSPKAGTSYSELEVVYVDRTSPLYYVKYLIKDKPGKFVVVATTRPELIFADTHLAVHPKDQKRKNLIGAKVLNPLTDKVMDIIGDEFVDPEFGTGVVKLTPAHDKHDFEVAKRHELPLVQAVDFQGKIMANGGKYAGMRVRVAREEVVKDLQDKGLIEKIDVDYQNRVATCYKTGGDIEPLPLSQFFVKVKGLTKKVEGKLDQGEMRLLGSGHDRILKHWLSNLDDWNISRQIVWGIRMPVWYEVLSDEGMINPKNSAIVVGFLNEEGKYVSGRIGELLETIEIEVIEKNLQTLTAPENVDYVVSRNKPGRYYLQETDTFDTWFSSAQWPVITLKTSKPGDFEFFYPTTVMETAYDILMFWVMRMMLMGEYLSQQLPFSTVYLHGLVRDEKGQKMSKSKGNVIDPITLVDKYGADALRMALVMGTTPGNDSAMGENKVRGMRNFSNKIWNAARFIKLQKQTTNSSLVKKMDSQFEEKVDEVINKVTKELAAYKLGQAAETVHNEFWHWFCDQSIEQVKREELSLPALERGFETFLRLLHPFMPYVTEAVAHELDMGKLLLISDWPEA
jgi:valyl-tRNA synthetase